MRSSTALVCSQHSAEVGSLSDGGETPSDGMSPPPVLSRDPPYPGRLASPPTRTRASARPLGAGASSAVCDAVCDATCDATWGRFFLSAALRRCRAHRGLPACSATERKGWSSSVAFFAAGDILLRFRSVESCG